MSERIIGPCVDEKGTVWVRCEYDVVALTPEYAQRVVERIAELEAENEALRELAEGIDVLRSIDQLRRDLTGYHGQLKSHNDLQRHCDNQRRRIVELEAIHERDGQEIAKLRELCGTLYGRLQTAQEVTEMGWIDARLTKRMAELGIEVG